MSITQMREELRNLTAQLETARARALSVAMDTNADADAVRNAKMCIRDSISAARLEPQRGIG